MPDSYFHVDNDDVFAGLFVVAIITFLLYLLIYLL